MKKAVFLLFGALIFFSVSLYGQKVFWSESNNSRIRVGNLGTTAITTPTNFITGLTNPRSVEVDQINNILYYHNFNIEDILAANLSTGAPLPAVITTGAMAGFYDFVYSDNAGGLFAPANDEVHGLYYIPWNNNNSGNDVKLNLGALSDDVFYGVAVDEGNEYVYLSNSYDGRIYRTGFSGGSMSLIAQLSNPRDIAYDPYNNDLYIINENLGYQLYRFDLDGGGLTQLFSLGSSQVQCVQPYAQFGKIYFSTYNTGIYAVNIDGTGSPVQVLNLAGAGEIFFDILEDWTLPVFTALSPLNNATNVSTTPTLTMTFDENIKLSSTAGTGNELNIRLMRLSDNFMHQSFDRTSGNISIVNNVMTLSGVTGLDPNAVYYVLVGNKVFSDLSGNNFAGISANTGWRFQTVQGVAITAPASGACVGSNTPLPDIVITEAANSNFKPGASQTMVFTFSAAGYSFQAGVGTVAHTAGRNISASALNVMAGSVTLTYTVTAENASDGITISGLNVVSASGTTPPANIIRSGGTGYVDGLPVNTIVATLTTQLSPVAPVLSFPDGTVFCVNSDVSGVVVTGTGTSLRWYNDLALTSEITALAGATSATGTDLGISSATSQTFNRYVTQTAGGCQSPGALASVVIDPGPQAISTAFTPQTSCTGPSNGAAHITDVNSEGLANYTVSWYDNTFTALGLNGPVLSDVAAGDYNALVTSSVTGCSNYAATITVPEQLEFPLIDISTVANSNCEAPNGSGSVSILNQVGPDTDYSFVWHDGPDTASPLLPISTSSATNLDEGVYSVIVQYNPTGCLSLTSFEILNEAIAPDFTLPSGEVCETVFQSGTANVDLTVYNSIINGGNADYVVTWVDGSNNPITAASVTSGTIVQFRVKSSTSGCETPGSLEFAVFTQPTPADAGTDQSVCGTTTILEGNMPIFGIGTWSIVGNPPGATLTSPSDPDSGFTGQAGSSYVLEWATYHVAQCPQSIATVNISFTAPPTVANAGSEQTVCDAPVTLSANTPTVGSGVWSIESGGGGVLGDPASPNSTFTGTAGTSYTLRWTITNGICVPSISEVTINITDAPTTAAAGTDQTNCGSSITLAANTPAVGTGLWTVVSGSGGTFVTPSSPASVFNGISGATYVLRWTISSPGCTPSSDDVSIQFITAPSTATAGGDQEICGNSTALEGNIPSIGSGNWTVVSGTGGSFANPALGTTTFTGVAGNTYSLRWTISSGVDCPVSSDEVIVAFVAPPTAATAGPDQLVCNTSTNLAANTPVVGTGNWTIVSGAGGTFANASIASSSFTGAANTTYVLRWTIFNGICEPTSDEVSISLVSPPTVAQAGPDQSICATSAALAGNTPSSGTGTWTVVSGSGGILGSPANPTGNFSGLIGNTYTLRWTIAQNGCPESTDDVTIQLKGLPQGTGVFAAIAPLCAGEEIDLTLTGVSNATAFDWAVPPGISIQSRNGASITVRAESGAGGPISVTPSNECGSTSVTNGNIMVLAVPEISINLPASPFPEESVNFSFTSDAALVDISWDFGDGGSSTSPSPEHAYGIGGEFTVSLVGVAENGCVNSDTKPFLVKTEPDLDDSAIKNVITANGDEKNRFLHIVNLDRHPQNEVRFLDRWGVEVYHSSNYQNDWDARGKDGQFLPAGQYICIVKLNDSGKVFSRTVSIIKGR